MSRATLVSQSATAVTVATITTATATTATITATTTTTTVPAASEATGVAVVCCLDGPGWLQKRYSLSVANVMLGLPASYKVQLFYKPSAQSLKGLRENPFIGQLAAAGRVILTELQGPWAKRSRSEVYLSTMFWESLAADNVFMFGHGGVRCLNSPLTLRNFTSQFDLIASNDGGFVSVRRSAVLAFLRSVLPPGADFLPKIHGPIPYLLGQLRKQPGIRVPPRDVLSRFNINDQSSRDEIPFTISGTMPNFTPEDRRAAIEACPEVKVRTSLGASFLTLLSFTFLSTSLLCSLSHHHLIILSLSTQKQQLALVLFR